MGGGVARESQLHLDLHGIRTIKQTGFIGGQLRLHLNAAVLHFLRDDDDPYGVVARLVRALAPGSFIAATHASPEHWPREIQKSIAEGKWNQSNRAPFVPRRRDDFARFFDGYELVAPGIVPLSDWRPDDPDAPRPDVSEVCVYGGVARSPSP
jgi:S-adenosyl methyltransferase